MAKSSIKVLPDDQRKFIEKLLREDRLTLNEMLDSIRAEFPTATIPSRSALGRAKQNFSETAKKMQEFQAASELLVSELGEDKDDRVGAMLTQTVSTLLGRFSMQSLDGMDGDEEKKPISLDDVGKLARATRHVIATRGMSHQQRLEIEKSARERMIKEQGEKLDEMVKSGGLGVEQAEFWRRDFLGVR